MKFLTFIIQKTDYLIRGIRYGDTLENVTEITFHNIIINKPIPSGTFIVKIPEGVEVVDFNN